MSPLQPARQRRSSGLRQAGFVSANASLPFPPDSLSSSAGPPSSLDSWDKVLWLHFAAQSDRLQFCCRIVLERGTQPPHAKFNRKPGPSHKGVYEADVASWRVDDLRAIRPQCVLDYSPRFSPCTFSVEDVLSALHEVFWECQSLGTVVTHSGTRTIRCVTHVDHRLHRSPDSRSVSVCPDAAADMGQNNTQEGRCHASSLHRRIPRGESVSIFFWKKMGSALVNLPCAPLKYLAPKWSSPVSSSRSLPVNR